MRKWWVSYHMFPCSQGIFDNIFGMGKLWDVKMQILNLISHVQFFLLLLTTVFLGLVSCVLYHLIQLNFLHFLSILWDFWDFSPLHLKQYFANISCFFIFGIMAHAWSHEFSKHFLGLLLHVQILPNIAKQIPFFTRNGRVWKEHANYTQICRNELSNKDKLKIFPTYVWNTKLYIIT